jgi:hypothetical protein
MVSTDWKLIYLDGRRELTETCSSREQALRSACGKKQRQDVLRIVSPDGKSELDGDFIDKWCKENRT